jgi:hypothetical protein
MKQLLWSIPMLLCLSCARQMSEHKVTRLVNMDYTGDAHGNQTPAHTASKKLGEARFSNLRQFCVMYYTKTDMELSVLFFVFDGNNEISYFYQVTSNRNREKGWHVAIRAELKEYGKKGVLVTMKDGQGLTYKLGNDIRGQRFEYILKGKKHRAETLHFGRPEFTERSGKGCFEITKWVDMPQTREEIESDPHAFVRKQYQRNSN